MADVLRNYRGGIWYHGADIEKKEDETSPTRGILTGGHPVLIFSEPPNATNTCTCMVLPISTASSVQMSENSDERAKQFFLVEINMPRHGKSYVEVGQGFITTTNLLRGYIGQVAPELMFKIEEEFLRFCCINPADHVQIPTTWTTTTGGLTGPVNLYTNAQIGQTPQEPPVERPKRRTTRKKADEPEGESNG